MVLPEKMPTKQSTQKQGDYSLVPKFLGYSAREDPTMLPVGTLVSPSQNVLIKTTGRVATVAGYVLDGIGSSIIDSGILSNFDFTNFKGDVRNIRAGFQTAAGNDGKLQYRYVTGAGTNTSPYVVNWVNLMTGLTNVRLCYTSYWDNTALLKLLLWVDGSNNVFAWNGAVTTFASGTANSVITLAGNNVLLTSYGAVTGTASFIHGENPGAYGTTFMSYVGLTTQPTNGQTLIFNINGGIQSIQFVSVIGATAGNVLIGANLAATNTNLLSLLQAPGTTNSTQVAFSGGNQTILGYITFASVSNTLTKQDNTKTWAQEGFSQTGTRSVVINGVSYTYTGGEYSQTLIGLSSDVSGSAVGAIIHQAPITTPLSSMTAILSTFGPRVIGCGRRNQVYLGTNNSNVLYISKVNSYTDYSFTSPVRVVGEGDLIPLDAFPVKFIPQEVNNSTDLAYDMYISEGIDTWAVIRATLSADLTKETLEHIRLKVAPLQGVKSERLATKMKNEIMFIGNDNVANFFGLMSYQDIPAIVDFSFPIIDDMNSYDFTDGSIFYYKNYVFIAIPKAGLIRMYNMTDQTGQYTSFSRDMEDVTKQPWFWESPITYPIAGFYVDPNGNLCGHSYTTSESYTLFTGGSLNGQEIDVNATFCFDDKQDRTQSKASDELYVEGYIQQNTVLSANVTGDLDSAAVTQTVTIDGNDSSIVAYGSGAHSLGKNSLGSQPLGGAQTVVSTRPAWFHVAKTYDESSFYLEQISFTTKGVDLAWELITFGTNATFTPEGNNSITQ